MSFNWAANVNKLPGYVPTFIDYGPTVIEWMPVVKSLHAPLSMMSMQPTPLPTSNFILPPQPVCAMLKHAVTLLWHPVHVTSQWMYPPHPAHTSPSHLPNTLCTLLPCLRYLLRAPPLCSCMAHVTCPCLFGHTQSMGHPPSSPLLLFTT